MSVSEKMTPKVIIQKPIPGKHSSHAVPIEGIAYGLPSSYELWVVKEPFPGNFHPDNGPAMFKGNKWYATAYIGNAEPFTDQGLKFKIHIIMAPSDSEAAQKYREYLGIARSKGWPGLQDLHGGIIVATVAVVRDDQILKEPQIVYKYISDKKKENWIRFCLVQLNYDLAAISPPADFGWEISDGDAIKDKIFKALKRAHSDKVNIICFPELSFSKDWIDEIAGAYKDIIIICGSYYQDGYNICQIIINGYVLDPPYRKCTPSIFETDAVTGRGMKSGDIIYIIQTEYGRFSVLTCSDYPQHSERICKFNEECKGVDFIINPCCDPNLARFQEKASSDCDIFALDVIQVNKAPEGNKYGKSCIIGREHDGIKDILINEKFRSKIDVRHKLCEIDKELMVVVDIDIGTKGPLAGIETDYQGRIRITRERIYEYKNDWLPHELEAKHTSSLIHLHKEACDLFRLGKYMVALETYEKIIRLNPNFTLAWTNKGIALEKLGRYKDALDAYESSIKLDPNQALAWASKGIILRKIGKYEEALECLDKSTELDSNYSFARIHKSMILENLGRYKEAIKVYKNAIELEPSYSSTWTSKVSSLEKRCRYKAEMEFKEIESYLETEKEIFEEMEIQVLQKEEAKLLSLMDREAIKEAEMEFQQWQDTNTYLVVVEEQWTILNSAKEEELGAFLKKMEEVAKEENAIEIAEAQENAAFLEMEKEIFEEMEIQVLQDVETTLLSLMDRESDKEAEMESNPWQDADLYLIEKGAAFLNGLRREERAAFLKQMNEVANEERAIEIAEAQETITYLETEKEILDEIEIQVLQKEEATILSSIDREANKEAEMEFEQWQDTNIHLVEEQGAILIRAKKEERAAFLKKMDAVANEEKAIEIAEAQETVTYLETEKEILDEIEIKTLQKEEVTILSLMNREAEKDAEIGFEQLQDIDSYLAEERAAFLNRMDEEAREEIEFEDYLDKERKMGG